MKFGREIWPRLVEYAAQFVGSKRAQFISSSAPIHSLELDGHSERSRRGVEGQDSSTWVSDFFHRNSNAETVTKASDGSSWFLEN